MSTKLSYSSMKPNTNMKWKFSYARVYVIVQNIMWVCKSVCMLCHVGCQSLLWLVHQVSKMWKTSPHYFTSTFILAFAFVSLHLHSDLEKNASSYSCVCVSEYVQVQDARLSSGYASWWAMPSPLLILLRFTKLSMGGLWVSFEHSSST